MILEDYNQFPLKWNFRLLWTRDDEPAATTAPVFPETPLRKVDATGWGGASLTFGGWT